MRIARVEFPNLDVCHILYGAKESPPIYVAGKLEQ
ncbi:hypothetical protein PAU_01755 [Photorhabdus asymbiotica]|uniref:Uncharacterized protein n=1 Tax=Photorhabdus asymbiotica subsp. asymbiotica (strain ATCC 43949 / 3105-77) TaxID=553480 RepID=C7BTJ2_PHOAA|nr:hypothetical protein PAU_01755 [Photorhabdus asymbiotica]